MLLPLFQLFCLLQEAHAFLLPAQPVTRHHRPLKSSPAIESETSHLSDEQLNFCKSYLNEHHQSDVLVPLVQVFTDIGATAIKKNVWLKNSFTVVDANITDISSEFITMDVNIQEGGKIKKESVQVPLDADPVEGMASKYKTLPLIESMCLDGTLPIDNFVRRMNRLCNIVKAYVATGKMIQMGVQLGGAGVGKLVSFNWTSVYFVSLYCGSAAFISVGNVFGLSHIAVSHFSHQKHDDMYLNQVPHSKWL